MNVEEWIRKSKEAVAEGAGRLSGFGRVDEEFKELHLELTYACNLRCRMCDIWGKYKHDPRLPVKEMPVEELIDYVQESKVLKKIEGVVISGGEPFLKKDVAKLMTFFLSSYPWAKVGVLSNLYNPLLTYRALKEVADNAGLERVWLGTSLDGMHESHNNTRGVADAFPKFFQSLVVLRKEFPALPVTVNFTLTTENHPDLFKAYTFCRTNGLPFSMQFPVPWKDAERFDFNGEQMQAIREEVHRIIAEEIRDFEEGRVDENSLMTRIYYLNGCLEYRSSPCRAFKRCIAGRRFCQISPEGKVYFCPVLKNALVGDLRHDPFDMIWNGNKARELRWKIDHCYCHCWLNCTIYPNAGEALGKRKVKEEHALCR